MSRIVAATSALIVAVGLVSVGVVAPVAAATPAGAAPSSGAAPSTEQAAATNSSRYTAIAPQRLLDTRQKSDPHHGAIRSRGTLALKVAGTSAVPAAATAVVLNVTVVDPTGGGHLTVYPNGVAVPTASNLNFVTGQNIANSVVVKIGSKGAVDFDNAAGGSTQLLADVSGYFGAPAAGGQAGFIPLSPTRLLDTRTTTGGHKGAVAAQKSVSFGAVGVHGIPIDASAVVLNLTAYKPARGGHVSAYPTGSAVPGTSNLNFAAGQTVPNLVIVPVGDRKSVSLFNGSTGATNLLADVFGYFTAGSPTVPGTLGALSPERLLDTRHGIGAPQRAVAAQGTVTLAVTGHGGVPRSDVSAVVLNVTAVDPTKGGHLTVYPSGTAPTSSNVNFPKGTTVPNFVVARLNSNGSVKIKNESTGTVQILADVAGFVLDTTRDVPAVTTSRYVSNLKAIAGTSGDNSSEGCLDGASGASLVLLDVGAQTTKNLHGAKGVSLVQNDPAVRKTDAQLVTALNGYAAEYARCNAAGTPVRIAIGTNTNADFIVGDPNYYAPGTAGKDWADNVVGAMAAQPHITFIGADDIESGFGSTEKQAEAWETAFLNNTNANLINNGSLDNCPDTFGSSAQCAAVYGQSGPTWTRANYVTLSYGLSPGRLSVLPQIYLANNRNQAAQWVNVDRSAGLRLKFEGTLTQSGIPGCGDGCGYTGSEGWAAFYNGLSTLDAAVSLPVATNLQLT